MLANLRTAAIMLLLLTALTGGVYPLCVTVVARVLFPRQASGCLVRDGERVVGSELIGQSFSEKKYFWGRLSATSPTPYNAAASGGSNFGPLHPGLREAVERRVRQLTANDGRDVPSDSPSADPPLADSLIADSLTNGPPAHVAPREPESARERIVRRPPIDLLTASGSGLDPHISPAAAEYQVSRVAAARGMPESTVREIVSRHTERRQLGMLGEPRVNVLLLNLDLDRQGLGAGR